MSGVQMTSIAALSRSESPADAEAEVLMLFERLGTSLYRLCHSTLRSRADAQDVVQETFLKLLEHLRGGGGVVALWAPEETRGRVREQAIG